MFEAIATFAGAATLGIIGWAFQINRQVGILEARDQDYKDLVNAQFAAVHQRLERMELQQIKIMNGKNH